MYTNCSKTRYSEIISIVTESTLRIKEHYLPSHELGKYAIFVVFFDDHSYVQSLNTLPNKNQLKANWLMVTEEDFIQALAVNALGGYAYVYELFKENLK